MVHWRGGKANFACFIHVLHSLIFFSPSQITYVDFFAYEVFNVLRIFESSMFDNCPGLIVSYTQTTVCYAQLLC